MDFVNIGDLTFSQVGLGTFPLKGGVLCSAMDCAVNNGYGLIDTAYKYQNETEIGEFVSEKSNLQKTPIVVQTKFSVTQLVYKKFLCFKYRKKTIKDAIEGSAKRLRKTCLDIYLLHAPSNGYVEYYSDLKKFREQRLVKKIGVCRFNERQLQDIRDKCGEYPAINQIEIHPLHTNKQVIDYCKENGIVVEARSLFTHGDAIQELMHSDILNGIAKEYDKSVPQVIVRWVIQQGLVAIVKSGTPDHIKENIDVFDFELTEKQMSMIDSMNRDQSFGVVGSLYKH